MKRIPVNEQETTIQFNRDESIVNIWTSDSTVMTKLDKLANDSESPWECVATERMKSAGLSAENTDALRT